MLSSNQSWLSPSSSQLVTESTAYTSGSTTSSPLPPPVSTAAICLLPTPPSVARDFLDAKSYLHLSVFLFPIPAL
jgi:hypothetical protein